MNRIILISVLFLLVFCTAFAENQGLVTYVSDLGLSPSKSENEESICYCNYRYIDQDTSMIEWSEDSGSYTITDNSDILAQLYINLLVKKEWESCAYVINKRSRFSYKPLTRSMHRYDSLEQYIEKAKDTLQIPNAIELYPPMKEGNKGDTVTALQQRLKDFHYLEGPVDGDFGKKTKKAVKMFQQITKLEKTGIADLKTQIFLFSDNVPEAPQMEVYSSVISFGGRSKSMWDVDGHKFSLIGNETKTLDTRWGKFIYYSNGDSTKIE